MHFATTNITIKKIEGLTYRKTCECHSPASGPRAIEDKNGRPEMMKIACDLCDKPWDVVDEPKARRRLGDRHFGS